MPHIWETVLLGAGSLLILGALVTAWRFASRRIAQGKESSRQLPEAKEEAPEPASRDDDVIISTLASHPTLGALVDHFLGGLPGRLEELRAAFQRSDLETLEHLAHGLRGAGGTYGFKALTEAADELEQRLRAGAGEAEIEAAFARLTDVCERAMRGAAQT